MVAHTGFLTVARRVQPAAGGSPGSPPPAASDADATAEDRPGPEEA
jgi:hypothetical protein